MDQYVDEARVTGFEPLIDTLILPDPKDRHVLAAAIHSHADVIVTSNLRDFPPAALAPFNIIAMTADDFLIRLLGDDPDPVIAALAVDRKHMITPPLDAGEYLMALEHDGLTATAAALRPMADRL